MAFESFSLFLVTFVFVPVNCCDPPNITLYTDWVDYEHNHNFSGQTTMNFIITKPPSPIKFFLMCQHNSPVRWVINEDLLRGEPPGESETGRTFKNFLDPLTYTYTAKYLVTLNKPSTDIVYICQTFDDTNSLIKIKNDTSTQKDCRRSVVLAHSSSTFRNSKSKTKNFTLRVLSPSDLLNGGVESLQSFDKQLAKVNSLKLKDNETCPFVLKLFLWSHNYNLVFGWDPQGGSQNVFSMPNAQALANADLFYPLLEERCIDYIFDENVILNCSYCLQRTHQSHMFFPQMMTYTLGSHRRALKGFFDLQTPRSFYYLWEDVDPKLAILAFAGKEIYKGQTITVKCFPSVNFFSKGTQIAWKFPNASGSAPDSIEGFFDEITEKGGTQNGGVGEIKGSYKFERDFLMTNNLNKLEIICICPLWNSVEWVNYTKTIDLQNSTLPFIISSDLEEEGENFPEDKNTTTIIYELNGTEKDFNITCEGSGVPLPTLKFTLPKINLGLEETEYLSDYSIIRVLRFPNITVEHEGVYGCVAKSLVGETQNLYEIKLHKPSAILPKFVVIIIIVAGIVVLVFSIVSGILVYKLRKEREEFIRKTEEVVKKFREGFPNTQELGFKSKSEYKEYEIPLSRWGLGNTLLGSGAFGVVQKGVIYYGDNRQDVVAVKTVNSPKEVEDFESSLMELTIMSYIGKHEHIVSLVGACTDNIFKRSILIGVEYCSNGDLLNYMQKRKAIFRSFVNCSDGKLSLDSITGRGSYANVANSGNFTSIDLYKWGFQIANGMDFLSSKKILHCDLAARNVLLTQDNLAKISDFGLSRHLIMSDNYTKKTNVGDEPWPNMGWTNEFMEELERGMRMSRPKYATTNMYDKVMLECWRNEPNERITFANARAFFETAITNLNSPEGKEDEFLNSVC